MFYEPVGVCVHVQSRGIPTAATEINGSLSLTISGEYLLPNRTAPRGNRSASYLEVGVYGVALLGNDDSTGHAPVLHIHCHRIDASHQHSNQAYGNNSQRPVASCDPCSPWPSSSSHHGVAHKSSSLRCLSGWRLVPLLCCCRAEARTQSREEKGVPRIV